MWDADLPDEEWVVRFLVAVGSDPSEFPPEFLEAAAPLVPVFRRGRPFYEAELQDNAIVDLSALENEVWRSQCVSLYLTGNPLDPYSLDVVIPSLCEQGAYIEYDGGSCGDPLCF